MYPDRANSFANVIHSPCTCTRTEHQPAEQLIGHAPTAPFHFPFIASPLPTRATHQLHHFSLGPRTNRNLDPIKPPYYSPIRFLLTLHNSAAPSAAETTSRRRSPLRPQQPCSIAPPPLLFNPLHSRATRTQAIIGSKP